MLEEKRTACLTNMQKSPPINLQSSHPYPNQFHKVATRIPKERYMNSNGAGILAELFVSTSRTTGI